MALFLWINACDTIKTKAMRNAKKAINIMRTLQKNMKGSNKYENGSIRLSKIRKGLRF